MAMKNCNHDSFTAIYEGDISEECPACTMVKETKKLADEMRSFVKRCEKILPKNEGETT